VTGWTKIPGGWALNLDGSDAGAAFSLPRLEVRPTPQGWRGLCMRRDGTRCDRLFQPGNSVHEARAAAEAAWGARG
jgi:hypothetical protein